MKNKLILYTILINEPNMKLLVADSDGGEGLYLMNVTGDREDEISLFETQEAAKQQIISNIEYCRTELINSPRKAEYIRQWESAKVVKVVLSVEYEVQS